MTHPKIIWWRPGHFCIKKTTDSHGAWGGSVHTYYGEVKVFSFPGSSNMDPFTSLEMSLGGRMWSRRYDRAYRRRWLGRLANQFAWEVYRRRMTEC